LVHPLSLPFTH